MQIVLAPLYSRGNKEQNPLMAARNNNVATLEGGGAGGRMDWVGDDTHGTRRWHRTNRQNDACKRVLYGF